MSFAPSPRATVWLIGTPSACAQVTSDCRLRSRVTIGPTIRPVSTPSTTSRRFANAWSMPASATRSSTTSWNPPETTPTVHPWPCNASISSKAPVVK